MEFTGVQVRSRDVKWFQESWGGQGRPGEVKGGQWSPEKVMGCQGGFVRSGGVQGRSEGFIWGHWRSGEVREVRVGQEGSGECRKGQENRSSEVRECQGRKVMESMGGLVSFENISLLWLIKFMNTNRFTCFITKSLRKFLFKNFFKIFLILRVHSPLKICFWTNFMILQDSLINNHVVWQY